MVFQKGHPGYKPKGAKSYATLAKEERRAIFEAEVSQVFVEKIHQARPEYLLDQFIGKSPDTSVNINLDANITEHDRELGSRLIGLLRRRDSKSV